MCDKKLDEFYFSLEKQMNKELDCFCSEYTKFYERRKASLSILFQTLNSAIDAEYQEVLDDMHLLKNTHLSYLKEKANRFFQEVREIKIKEELEDSDEDESDRSISFNNSSDFDSVPLNNRGCPSSVSLSDNPSSKIEFPTSILDSAKAKLKTSTLFLRRTIRLNHKKKLPKLKPKLNIIAEVDEVSPTETIILTPSPQPESQSVLISNDNADLVFDTDNGVNINEKDHLKNYLYFEDFLDNVPNTVEDFESENEPRFSKKRFNDNLNEEEPSSKKKCN